MLKNISKLEVVIGEKTYSLLCDNDSPTTSIKEACFQFLKFVGQVEDQVKAQNEQVSSELKAEEIPSIEQPQDESCGHN